MRSAIVLAVVVAVTLGARSFLPAGATLTGTGALLAFGFLLIASIQVGHIFHTLRLPHLTGYLLTGVVFGPEVVKLVTPVMVKDLQLVKNVAVGLIALVAGCELNFRKLRPFLRAIGVYSVFNQLTAGAFLFPLFFFALSPLLPVTSHMTQEQRLVISLLVTNVLCAFSPSVVIGVVSETKARGPYADLCVSIVVLADLVIVLTFAITNAVVRAAFPGTTGSSNAGAELAIHIFGSMGIGVVVGAALALYTRRVGKRVALMVFGVLFVVAEGGSAIHIDPLLSGLTAGLFVENVSPVSGHDVIHAIEAATMPTFAMFFSVIGCEIHLHGFLSVAPFGLGLAATRALGIFVGSKLGGPLSGVEKRLRPLVPLGLIPQAGVAIALANLVRTTFHPWGEGIGTLLLGTIVCNELVGPVIFRIALGRSGEIPGAQALAIVTTEASREPAPASSVHGA